jgi:hypothetical protein
VTGWEKGDIVLKREDRRAIARLLGIPEAEFVRAMEERWNAAH